MSNLMNRMKSVSTIKETDVLSDSKFFNKKDMISTNVPAVNIAFSGKIDGGFAPGLTIWAGPSKNFKTGFTLLSAKAYMDKYDDAVLLFYDSEFGTPQAYFDSFGIDKSRVLHTPIVDVEQLKIDCMKQLQEIKRGDHVIIIIDSIGNLASRAEVDNALNEKTVADLQRAKSIKSFFRMITPHLNLKDIPMMVISHIYMTMEFISKPVLSGGVGQYYSADNIFIMGRQQDKDGKDLSGYNFIINVEKSRFVREKSKIPVNISFENGISKWSGLLDLALESGHIVKPKNARFSMVDMSTGEYDEKGIKEEETENKEFWQPILSNPSFKKFIEDKYCISHGAIMSEEDSEVEIYGKLDTE